MELFFPSILIFLLALIVVMILIPQFSPIIIVTCAITLLVAGMYNHFSMFWNEYAQSTWQTSLKTFAPGIIIIAIFIYLLFAIGAFFTGGKVPVPTLPEMSLPSAESATNAITSSINDTMNATKGLFGMNDRAKNEGPRNEGPRNEGPRNQGPRNEQSMNDERPKLNVGRLIRRNNNGEKSPTNDLTRSQLAVL